MRQLAVRLAARGHDVTVATSRHRQRTSNVVNGVKIRAFNAGGKMVYGLSGQIDIAFIDANKNDYDAYYERCLKLVRRGGLILIDNVLWGGSVANLAESDEDTMAIRALNAKLKSDERVDLTLFAVGDGMTCALKR